MNFSKNTWLLICVAALGYFVDIYDLILYNVVKFQSLTDLGFTEVQIKEIEPTLFNWQMIGMLVGGLFWGVLGDKKGRISVLFGSILLYSLANIANAFVQDIFQYKLMRFIAGVGLAGELGAGITLIVESMDKEKRGWGTMIIVTFGALGAVVASLVGNIFHWQTSYIIGGCLGLVLLLLRVGALESGMFTETKENIAVRRGHFFDLFKERDTVLKYVACIGVGLPIWFFIGVLINQSYRFKDYANWQMDVDDKVLVSTAVMYAYIGLSVGDLFSGALSQVLRSRKKVIYIFLAFSTVIFLLYIFSAEMSFTMFRLYCFAIGSATGFWALFVTNASEQFGTNIRSTVTNTVPNFVRGAVVPINLSFKFLIGVVGLLNGALIVGLVCLFLSFISILFLKETFNKELNYVE